MIIRTYITSDLPAILHLFDENTPQYFDAVEREGLTDYLENYTEDYFVVEEHGEILGAGGINYDLQGKTAVLSWDIVKPSEHGKGIGRKLTQHRIQYINRNQKIELIKVRTSQHTYKFYEKMGFKLLEVEKDYWAEGFDLYEMEQRNEKA